MNDIDKKEVVDLLNRILESELAGVVRYTHYSLLVFGYHRIPISVMVTRTSDRISYARSTSGRVDYASGRVSVARNRPAAR